MSEKYNTIFAELGSYEVKPPDSLTDKVLQAVAGMNKTGQSGISKPDQSSVKTRNIAELNSLQNFELAPPQFDFNSITLRAGTPPATQSQPVKEPAKNKTTFRIWLRVAAAVFIIGISTWAFYYMSTSNNKTETNINTSIATVTPPDNKNAAFDTTINTETDRTLVTVKALVLNKKREAKERIKAIRIKNNMPVLTEDGQHIEIADNDLFLTLVKFNYTESAAFLTNIEKTKKIQLDQFSYVTISDKMAALLTKMYATRHNKKPTRQAKKIRAKLEQWKKLDEKHFDDNNNKKDPLDIVDLSEFILN